MMPSDFTLMNGFAIGLLLFAWFAYPLFLAVLGQRSLNSQLEMVRRQWLLGVIGRTNKPFDALLLGHIVNSVSFFGSATLLVLAGLLSALLGIESVHRTLEKLHLFESMSLELFVIQYLVVSFVIGLSFFSFIYALRKLVYLIALVGALPETPSDDGTDDPLVNHAATVMTEAVKTFNFGIRGYYYAVASLFLFVTPAASVVATVLVTLVILYRQIGTKTSRAIRGYVDAAPRSRIDK